VRFVRVQGEDAHIFLWFREYRPVLPPPLKRGFDLLYTGHLRQWFDCKLQRANNQVVQSIHLFHDFLPGTHRRLYGRAERRIQATARSWNASIYRQSHSVAHIIFKSKRFAVQIRGRLGGEEQRSSLPRKCTWRWRRPGTQVPPSGEAFTSSLVCVCALHFALCGVQCRRQASG